MVDADQDKHDATFKFIEEVYNCPAASNVSSVVSYKDSKNKQNKMEQRSNLWLLLRVEDKVHFTKEHRSTNLLSSATVLSRPC